MTRGPGRNDVQTLVDRGELEAVGPSDDVAAALLRDAAAHLRLAARGVDDDPASVLQLSYDAARKAAAALLAIQGLRATTRGGHIALLDAVRSQFDRGVADLFRRVDRLRRRRNQTEYPSVGTPNVTAAEAQHALDLADEALDAAERIVATGTLDEFT